MSAAVDWGGTKLLVGLVGRDGTVIASRQSSTPRTSPAAVLDAAAGHIEALLAERGIEVRSLAGVGVSAPGIVNTESGHLVIAPATGWRDVDVHGHLSARFPGTIRVANDVDNCMRAELRFGAGQTVGTLLWVTVSTGIGGCISHDGAIFAGGGSAGEVGHIVVEELGPRCGCGNRGCLEAVASGPAIARRARELGVAVDSSQCLAALAADGNEVASAVFVEAAAAIGRGVGAVINVIDPDLIVLGGGVSPSLNLSVVKQSALEHSIRVRVDPPDFVLTRLGAHASLIGASILAFERTPS